MDFKHSEREICSVNGISCVLAGEAVVTCERAVVPCFKSLNNRPVSRWNKLACDHWEGLFSQLQVLTWIHNYPKAEKANLNDWYIIFIGSHGCCLHSLLRTYCTGWSITESFLRIIKRKPVFIPHAGFELLLNNFFNSLSLGFLFHLQILSFPSTQLPKQWGWPCCFGARHTCWHWWSFTCAEMMLAVYCGNDKTLPGLLVACWFGCCWGEGVCHSGVRGSSCVGVRTPWLSELLPWPLMVAGQSRPWFLLCRRGQSPAGCSAWEIRSAACFSQTHFLVTK